MSCSSHWAEMRSCSSELDTTVTATNLSGLRDRA